MCADFLMLFFSASIMDNLKTLQYISNTKKYAIKPQGPPWIAKPTWKTLLERWLTLVHTVHILLQLSFK